MSHEADRPASVAKMLENVIGWLDLGDRAFEQVARLRPPTESITFPLGHGVQDDLRRIAEWLKAHPETDETVWYQCFAKDPS